MLTRQTVGVAMILGIVGGIGLNVYLQAYPMTVVYAADPEPPQVVLIGEYIEWTPERINQEIEKRAVEYGRNASYLKAIIKCESQGSTTVQSYHVKNGVREDSWGLVQIHLPSHKTVTKEEAQDPEFAINFLAKNIGKVHWSCEDLI